MKKTRAIILGGGISGLSLAYFLSQDPKLEITLLEKGGRFGGHLETEKENEFFFEKGPRTFKTSRSSSLLALCKELQIEDKIIGAEKSAEKRYLWNEGKLSQFPSNPLQFLSSKLTRSLAFSLLKEWSIAAKQEDESIYDFVSRRLNKKTAELLFDPLVTGIYAGDSKELSVESCFSTLKEWERSYGSLTRGFFCSEKKGKTAKIQASLFSFKEGIQTLVDALLAKTRAEFFLNEEVSSIDFSKEEMEVVSSSRKWKADVVFSALPSYAAGSLFEPWNQDLSQLLKSIRYAPITTVNLGYKKEVLPVNAFGYLIPRKEKEEILGAVFDSKIFLEQNKSAHETRLTVMIGSCLSEKEGVERALRAVKKHLGIANFPDFVQVRSIEKAIPQFAVGHQRKLGKIQEIMTRDFRKCFLLGNYLSGVSVNDCIEEAKQTASRWHF